MNISNLEKIKGELQPGLGVDIDETLSWTIGHWVERMLVKFGNPENFSIQEMVSKYRYTQNVPYWQTPEALAWMDEQINSNEVQKELPLIEGADHYLRKIHEIVPIAAYITIRPEGIRSGTEEWLEKHGFPKAPVICRPKVEEDGVRWKAMVLSTLFPQVKGIIDDNDRLLEFLGDEYAGKIFLYNHQKERGKENIFACPDWLAVYKRVKIIFG